MAAVRSKNLFAVLDDDASDTAPAPVKTVDKTSTHTVKRNADEAPASKGAAFSTGPRRGPGGNEGAFRDRGAGSDRNRSKPTDEAGRGGPRGGFGARGRGGRGGRFPRERDDRHSKGLPSGSDKQAAQSWGATDGDAEQKDEQAGEEIATKEQQEATAEDAAATGEDAAEAPVEEEDKSISYEEYLKRQKDAPPVGGELALRQVEHKAPEGTKALVKEDDEFMPSTGGKTHRHRERKSKAIVDVDTTRVVENDRAPRGGRGGGGGRGGPRGEFRGAGRGGRGGRGRGGDFRGDFRGDFSGGRGGAGAQGNARPAINPNSTAEFPGLGS